ncbi:DUF4124 domain-containing protein [Undibacterium terreum]|uniref:DUF4124 domain-containing protein n=1 Tax=Undibacterium terreum TaxID=1224302 RepID=A0A916XCK5_9BURK|nr:DUF4124 domain-containing protein [Undibacterium terreum]GGC63602.1 hypothetical protein GCM10011396_08210 [Undibacterium terreum]
MRRPYRFLFVPLVFLPGLAFAQVYKCTDQSGTVSYSGAPCAKSVKSQQLTKIETPAPSDSPPVERDWEKENQEFKQRQLERNAKESAQRGSWNPAYSRDAMANQKKQSDKNIIAACEANRGVHCSNPNVIARIRSENTPLTKSQQQQAVAERRARERDEAFNRAAAR